MARRISFLNSQIVVNSGSISNPSNSVSVIKNSERVRNDLLNISEYINGYIYYLTKSLTSIDLYPFDAAEKGICGDTIITDTEATLNSGDIFWFSTGENSGRAKTLKESFEALEAKLIQQQINISVNQTTNITNLAGQLNDNILLANKVGTSTLGVNFTKDSDNLNYSLSQYVYHIYNTLFSGQQFYNELDAGDGNFPSLSFNQGIAQTLIEGSINSYPSLKEDLEALKTIINGDKYDPSFTVTFDDSVYSTEPTNIKECVEELENFGVELTGLVEANGLSIVNIEDQLAAIQGVSLATDEIAGVAEQATKDEILMGVGTNGDKKLFMSADNFCDVITASTQSAFLNTSVSKLGQAWKRATDHVMNDLSTPRNRNMYYLYYNADISGNNNYTVSFNRSYFLTTETANGTIIINSGSIGAYKTGSLLTIKKSDDVNEITINVNINNTYLINGNSSYTLSQPYECVTFMLNKEAERLEIISKYIQ